MNIVQTTAVDKYDCDTRYVVVGFIKTSTVDTKLHTIILKGARQQCQNNGYLSRLFVYFVKKVFLPGQAAVGSHYYK